MSDLDYKFAHVNRHSIIADWLMSDDDWSAMAERLHDRLKAAADRMAPFHGYAKCARCEEVVNNPKKHDCAPIKRLPSLTIAAAAPRCDIFADGHPTPNQGAVRQRRTPWAL